MAKRIRNMRIPEMKQVLFTHEEVPTPAFKGQGQHTVKQGLIIIGGPGS